MCQSNSKPLNYVKKQLIVVILEKIGLENDQTPKEVICWSSNISSGIDLVLARIADFATLTVGGLWAWVIGLVVDSD